MRHIVTLPSEDFVTMDNHWVYEGAYVAVTGEVGQDGKEKILEICHMYADEKRYYDEGFLVTTYSLGVYEVVWDDFVEDFVRVDDYEISADFLRSNCRYE